MIDLIYYVITVIAIFVALDIGMIIGSVFIDNELILNEQQRLVEQLERDFQDLRDNKRVIEAEMEEIGESSTVLKNFTEEFHPLVFKENLEDYNLLLLMTGSRSADTGIIEFLNKAGPNVKVVELDMENL